MPGVRPKLPCLLPQSYFKATPRCDSISFSSFEDLYPEALVSVISSQSRELSFYNTDTRQTKTPCKCHQRPACANIRPKVPRGLRCQSSAVVKRTVIPTKSDQGEKRLASRSLVSGYSPRLVSVCSSLQSEVELTSRRAFSSKIECEAVGVSQKRLESFQPSKDTEFQAIFKYTPWKRKRDSTSPSQMVSTKLILTPPEKLFRQCLLECRESMASSPGMGNLVMRWTGGWVRDKLLGVQSHDIDVALSTMTGLQFGEALQKFMAENGKKYEEEAKKQGFKADLKSLHKIAANPEKSKHLETITTKMFGIDVDFVNLRKEVYAEDSRNPQMEFGTAEEDALRRDATVNALFYNLDTQEVEDFTRRGLNDMDHEIICTPLAPYQTFKDDPLRVLRLIRFACRLGYNIEESAQKAMTEPQIHEALRLKISRERVGVEIEKILNGPDPYTGLKLVNNSNLYASVFADPAAHDFPDLAVAQAAYDALQHILDHRSGLCLALRPKENQHLSWFLAAYVPWYSRGSKKAVQAAREGIKATNNLSKILDTAIVSREAITNAVTQVNKGEATRGSIGMLLRQLHASWRSHILYALLCDIVDGALPEQVERYQKFAEYLQQQELEDAHLIDKEVVLKGNEIMGALEVKKAGPWLKIAVDMVAEWQFNNKDTATQETATEMIRSRKRELGLE